jgi:hypothetical protein
MVLASPGPLLTPPPSSSPPKTPFRSYSVITPPRHGNPTPPPPGGSGSSRQGRGIAGQNGQSDRDFCSCSGDATLRGSYPTSSRKFVSNNLRTRKAPSASGGTEWLRAGLRATRATTQRQVLDTTRRRRRLDDDDARPLLQERATLRG